MNRDFTLDIVFVIAATNTMTPFITEFKNNAYALGDKIFALINKARGNLKNLRIRIVDFCDFAMDGDDTIHATDFFTIPSENDKLAEAINGIDNLYRGGDIPDNGLEALHVAMNSDWVDVAPNERVRHLIVLLTDTLPLHLGERNDCFGYNKDDYPSNIDELTANWEEYINSKPLPTHRLLMFVPYGTDQEDHTWDVVSGWIYSVTNYVKLEEGLKEINIDKIVEEIMHISLYF